MRTTIDAAGRVVIPKAIRDGAGLRPGSALDVTLVGERIELEPAPQPVQLVREGHFLVAVPASTDVALTAEVVEGVRREIHDSRAADAAADAIGG